ncbi:MAG: aminotransferase class IV [Planctomyces sp.]|nr:aminotransferase class IV [Planctomyces sp.]
MDQPFSPVAWINGCLCPFENASVPIWDLGVVAGASVTEMARTFRHIPFRLDQHLERFVQSVKGLGMPLPWDFSVLREAAHQVVAENCGGLSPEADLGLVVFQTAGVNPTYLQGDSSGKGTTAVHTFPLPFGTWKFSFENGVRLRIPSVRQIPEECLPVHYKIRNRLHWWLADQEAASKEAGSKALLLDLKGNVAETSTSCFFAVCKGEVLSADSGVLNSMSRRIVEELCQSLQIPFRRTTIARSILDDAEECFLSSTPVCLLPVSSIDGSPVGTGRPGPVFNHLVNAWSDLCGVDLRSQILHCPK